MMLRSLLLAASMLVPAFPAAAESLLLPELQTPAATAAQPAQEPVATTSRPLIPFTEAADRFRLSGEYDVEEYSFQLSDKQAAEGGKLVVAIKNAVSVLPDTGTLRVEVNGKAVGDLPIASPFEFTPNRIALSGAQLRPGRNVVRLVARQHHRVDCSLQATYELWTDVDPVVSGFEPAGNLSFASFADLYSVGRIEGGATELRLVVPGGAADAKMLDAALPVVQALALYLDREDLIVTVADRPGDGPGIDLFVSDRPMEATSDLVARAPMGVSFGRSQDPARAQLIFRANGPEDLTRLLVETVRSQMSAGLKQQRSGPEFGRIQANAKQTFTLKDAGLASTAFSGRLMRTHFDVTMPADFYPAEYGTMDLNLSAATAPGLDPASQLLIRVNDRVVNSFPFRNTDGQTFTGKLIELPLRAFRPGVNKIEMLAELPNANDKSCAPGARDDDKPRFILLGETAMTVPPLARVTRLPDLAAFSGNAYPYSDAKPFDIFLEKPDSHAASAALTVLARLTLSAGRPLKGNFRLEPAPVDLKENALVISTEIGVTGPDGKPLASNDGQRFKVDDRAAGVMKSDMMATATVPQQPVTNEPDGEDLLIRAFESANAEKNSELSWSARFKYYLSTVSARFSSWLSYEDASQAFVAREDTLLSVVQVANREGGISTVIRAASADDLSKGIRRLTDPSVWRSLDGGAALIDAKSGALVTMQGMPQSFVEVTDQSFGNYRRIAAAWFSDNFQFYVALVILLIGLFAAWLGKVVPTRGVRTVK